MLMTKVYSDDLEDLKNFFLEKIHTLNEKIELQDIHIATLMANAQNDKQNNAVKFQAIEEDIIKQEEILNNTKLDLIKQEENLNNTKLEILR